MKMGVMTAIVLIITLLLVCTTGQDLEQPVIQLHPHIDGSQQDKFGGGQIQQPLKRSFRGILPDRMPLRQDGYFIVETEGDEYDYKYQERNDKLLTFSTKPANASFLKSYEGATVNIGMFSSKKSPYAGMFTDPLWDLQWYAHDYRTEDGPVMDLNLVPVYKMGITGKGITVAVVDEGVQHDHPDLADNFLIDLSYDMAESKPGSDPDKYRGDYRPHGTKCAGVIAMKANNSVCGVGVAFNAKIAGIKTAGKHASEYKEGLAMIYNLDKIHIYSSSWGPDDDGRCMDKASPLIVQSFLKGVTEGRDGKGVVYIFAGGNGKREKDNCGADSLVNNAYTLPIASASQRGKITPFSERCPALFATAYSGGDDNDERVATIDVDGQCSTHFSGTSASAPLAAGMIALVFEANSNLTYRDIMHIIVMSSEIAPLADNKDTWYRNGKGFWVSNDFGFGMLNAENMVLMAKNWTNVPEKKICKLVINLDKVKYLSREDAFHMHYKTDACANTKDAVLYLEQIELSSTVEYGYRGGLSISITSAQGTETTLLEPRLLDVNRRGLDHWSIKSTHSWGEDPRGTWQIKVKANKMPLTPPNFIDGGLVHGFTLTLHGTSEPPVYHTQLPRSYAAFRLPS